MSDAFTSTTGRKRTVAKASKCVCTICTCGKHKCPSDPFVTHRYDPALLQTAYQQNFHTHNCPVHRRVQRPPQKALESMPFDGQTTAQSDFVKFGNVARKSFKPTQDRLATEPFTGTTMYDAAFKGESVRPRRSMKPEYKALGDQGQFNGVTTNQADFHKWDSKPAEPFKPRQKRDVTTDDRDFQTEAGRRFTDKGGCARQSMAPKPADLHEQMPFDGVSTAKADFLPWDAKPSKGFKPVYTRDAVADDRQFSTETARNFTNKGSAVRRSMKPQQSVLEASQPFDGISTNQADFHRWDAKPSANFKPKQKLTTSDEDRNFTTESIGSYDPKSYAARRSMKPEYKALGDQGQFNGVTTNQADFHKWDSKPAEPFKPRQKRDVTTDDRDFQTEAGRRFTDKGGCARQSMKPQSITNYNNEDRDFSTTQRDFTPIGVSVCPAAALAGRNEKTGAGHLYYEPDATGAWSKAAQ